MVFFENESITLDRHVTLFVFKVCLIFFCWSSSNMAEQQTGFCWSPGLTLVLHRVVRKQCEKVTNKTIAEFHTVRAWDPVYTSASYLEVLPGRPQKAFTLAFFRVIRDHSKYPRLRLHLHHSKTQDNC